MIYYPLSVLMLAGIREILIITTPHDQPAFKRLLGNGSQFGLQLEFSIQESPDGLAQAMIIGERFIGNDDVCLILGDNIFHGQGLSERLKVAVENAKKGKGPTIFGCKVDDPERYGVVEFDDQMNAISIEEKPETPKSRYAVTGLYFYDNRVVGIAKGVKPSSRGELEITCINNEYIALGDLNVELLGRGFVWRDAGTHESFYDTTQFVRTFEKIQGQKIACLEEIAYNKCWIDKNTLSERANYYKKTEYGKYLSDILNDARDTKSQ